MKNTITTYAVSTLIILLLFSCSDDNESFNENNELTAWIQEYYSDINNANLKYLSTTHFIKNNKIMNTTETFFEENGAIAFTLEKDFIYENEILKSIEYFNNGLLDAKSTYTYNTDNIVIEINLEHFNRVEFFYKILYEHQNNSVNITELQSSDGVNYVPADGFLSAKLNFDLNDNLIHRETVYEGFDGMPNEIEITDFTYNSNSNLIEMTHAIEYCTYSTIKNPVELIYTSTYGKKNFQLLRYDRISPNISYSICKNILETYKPNATYDVEIINTLNSNELLSKVTRLQTFVGSDNFYNGLVSKTTHEFIYN